MYALILALVFSFWKKLGTFMSKVSKDQSVVHFMESNVGGNKQGEEVREGTLKLSLMLTHAAAVLY